MSLHWGPSSSLNMTEWHDHPQTPQTSSWRSSWSASNSRWRIRWVVFENPRLVGFFPICLKVISTLSPLTDTDLDFVSLHLTLPVVSCRSSSPLFPCTQALLASDSLSISLPSQQPASCLRKCGPQWWKQNNIPETCITLAFIHPIRSWTQKYTLLSSLLSLMQLPISSPGSMLPFPRLS